MLTLPQAKTKRLVAIHGWSGAVLGLLLYAVVLTGAIAVFADEIGTWSQGGAETGRTISEPVDRHLRQLARSVDPSLLEEVSISKTATGALRFGFHTHRTDPESGNVEDYTVVYHVSPLTGEVLSEREGFRTEVRQQEFGLALQRFLVDLHVQLYVPAPWGLLLTGVLGLAMMVAGVSGLLIHRHLIRDIFVAPRGDARLVGARDRHVLAASWGLPFSFLLAFTGAFFSFALSLGLPVVAMVAFGGDQEALIQTVVGQEELADTSPSPLASLDYIVWDSTDRAGSGPVSVRIAGYGTAGAKVTVFHGPSGGHLTGTRHLFDGVTRGFLGTKPIIGTQPSAGAVAVSLMAPLHFGNFAGLASKTAWLALGAAMAYVIATGMQMWVKRRQDVMAWRHVGRAVTVTIWGLPLALLGSAVGFFVTLPAGDPIWWTPASFVLACVVLIAMGCGRRDPSERYCWLLGALCLGLPLLRHLTGGTSWSEALLDGQAAVLSIDLLLLGLGVAALWWPRRKAETQAWVPEPAE